MAAGANYPFRTALVTGASSGIGEAMVRRLAAAGVRTVVVARRKDRLDALAAELPGVEALAADLTDPDGLAAVAERLASSADPIDLLVNNAGFGTSGNFIDHDVERSVGEVTLNISAVIRLTHAAIVPMVERKRGWVLNVGSIGGFQPTPTLAVYGATKAFVLSFSEALSEELHGTGVKITVLCPGLTRTEFIEVSSSDDVADRMPEMFWQSADAVAGAGLDAVARGTTVEVPGLHNKAFVMSTSTMPRGLVRRVGGLVTRLTR